jgi:broad specificity phosphatase PhoE
MSTPTIYYIRHGETAWNVEGRLQGTLDIPLNDRGRAQASHAGHLLAELLLGEGRDKEALSFVASPLGRARSTMELVRRALRLPPDNYALDNRLREIGYGVWEGSTLAEMQATDPELYAMRQTAKWTMSPRDGETYAAVQLRMREWYDSLLVDTVAVAHGGTARALMVALGIETADRAADLFIEQGALYVFRDGGLTKYR